MKIYQIESIVISFFGKKELSNPCGLSGYYTNGVYHIYISDNDLNKIFEYEIVIKNDRIDKLKKKTIVEFNNAIYNNILVDEEKKRILACNDIDKFIYVYTLEFLMPLLSQRISIAW